MTTTPSTPPGDRCGSKRRRRWTRRVLLGGGVALAIAGAGAWYSHAQPRHHGSGMMGAMDAESASEWAQLMTRQMLRRIDATPEQETKIQAIVAGALKELLPMREGARAARSEALQLVSAPAIDRAAIEKLRGAQIAMHDQASKRMMQAVLEIADALSPAQREQLTGVLAERRWGPHR